MTQGIGAHVRFASDATRHRRRCCKTRLSVVSRPGAFVQTTQSETFAWMCRRCRTLCDEPQRPRHHHGERDQVDAVMFEYGFERSRVTIADKAKKAGRDFKP